METPNSQLQDTIQHIAKVRNLLHKAAGKLEERGRVHDASKLQSPEKEGYEQLGAELKGMTYGSKEYRESLERLKPVLDHHYAHNAHHPEFWENGVDGMSLFDVMEMLLDWKASTERVADGDIWKSIDINADRFKLSPQLVFILKNTANELGW